MNILVIDIGTSSMRGILFTEAGEKRLSKQVPYQSVHKSNGHVEQPVKDWEDALLLITQAISSRSEVKELPIDAIAITAQRSSVIPVNKDGKPLMPAIMWQDTRNQTVCQELEPYHEMVTVRSGANINTVFSGGKMAWVAREEPDIFRKVYKFVNIPEYVMHLMTDGYVTDYTYGSRSNLMNIRTCEWDDELLRIYQIEKGMLCELQEPGSVCGVVSKSFSEVSGIKAGLPVISAGGDQQCAAVGQGAYKEGRISIVAGTGAFLVTAIDRVPEQISPNIICNHSAVKGKYILEANTLTCCSAFDWFCRNFYDADPIDYNRINKDLVDVYGDHGSCIALPYYQGRSTPEWNPAARAVFSGISLSTTRRDLLKAVVEGICMEINNNILLLKEYVDIDCAYISGGLTNSKVINHIQSDVYGIPLYHMEDSESTALGALMVALFNMGVYASMEEAFQALRSANLVNTYEPSPGKHDEYEIKRNNMNLLYDKIYK